MKGRKGMAPEVDSEKEMSTHRKGTAQAANSGEEFWKNKYIVLSQENNKLLQKEKKYLEQLQTFEGRVEKQNQQSLELQTLYRQLMDKYGEKELEVEQLQVYYQPPSEAQSSQVEILKKQVQDLTDCLNEHRKSRIKVQREQKQEREKEKCLCQKYFQSDLPSIREAAYMFDDLQRRINAVSLVNLKFQYQNNFLKSRNKDLQAIREEMTKMIAKKQEQLNRTRDQYIRLIELEDATNKYLHKSNIGASVTSIVQQTSTDNQDYQRMKTKLYAVQDEVKILNQVVSAQRQKISSLESELELVESNPKYQSRKPQSNDFFSFSHQKRAYRHYVDDERDSDIPTPVRQLDQVNDLPAFPQELDIEELIRTMGDNTRKSRTHMEDDDQQN